MRKAWINSRVLVNLLTALSAAIFAMSSAIWARSYFNDMTGVASYIFDDQSQGLIIAEADNGCAGIVFGVPKIPIPEEGGPGSLDIDFGDCGLLANLKSWNAVPQILRWLEVAGSHGTLDGRRLWRARISLRIWPLIAIIALLLAFRAKAIAGGLRPLLYRADTQIMPPLWRAIVAKTIPAAVSLSLACCVASIYGLIHSEMSPGQWSRTTWKSPEDLCCINCFILKEGSIQFNQQWRYPDRQILALRDNGGTSFDSGWSSKHDVFDYAYGWISFGLDGDFSHPNRGFFFAIHLWFAALLFAIGPALYFVRKFLPKREPPKGMCLICGYDLRATPNMCPECGTTVDLAVPA